MSVSEDKYPFPMAAVERRMRSNINNKIISTKSKIALNKFLGTVIAEIAGEMNRIASEENRTVIREDDFKNASQPFIAAQNLQKELKRLNDGMSVLESKITSMMNELGKEFGFMDETHSQFIEKWNHDNNDIQEDEESLQTF